MSLPSPTRWARCVTLAQGFVLRVLPAIGILFLVALLARDMLRQGVEVAPLSVPTALAEAGLSPEVAANRMLDALQAAARAVQSEPLARPMLDIAGRQPDFAVPIAGLSLRGLADLLRSLFGLPDQRITGEILREGEVLRLRLRMAGAGRVADAEAPAADGVDALFAAAALDVWRHLQPQLYAWVVSLSAPTEADALERLEALMWEDGGRGDLAGQTVRLLMIRAVARAGRTEEALALAEELVRTAPGYALGHLARGRNLISLGRLEEAEAPLREAMRLSPNLALGYAAQARLALDRGRPEDALALARRAGAASRAEPQARIEESAALLALGRVGEAVRAARLATALEARNSAALIALGKALLALPEPGAALEAFEDALRQSPSSPEATLGRGLAQAALGERAAAAEALERTRVAAAKEPRLRTMARDLESRLRAAE
ncbi:MAG: tetratricopeptide repeat protein [Acetobacteraceae bacterium]|nr:tetratricopeptide repeat protein [Acetobacteraceae bacterium]